MKHGINYDTGFLPGEQLSRKTFDVEAVRRDMRTIADDLHCSVVRVSGRDPERLSVAAEEAAAAGLEVWFSPFPVDLTPEETMDCLIECAERAEALRGNGAEVIFVAGCEMSAYCGGYLPGDTFLDRFEAMRGGPEFWASLGPIMQRLNGRLGEVAEAVRKRFGGRVTYASGQWELVDWSPFDLVSDVISANSRQVIVLEVGEDKCCAGDVADSAGADGDVLEGPPAAFEQGEAAFAETAQGS